MAAAVIRRNNYGGIAILIPVTIRFHHQLYGKGTVLILGIAHQPAPGYGDVIGVTILVVDIPVGIPFGVVVAGLQVHLPVQVLLGGAKKIFGKLLHRLGIYPGVCIIGVGVFQPLGFAVIVHRFHHCRKADAGFFGKIDAVAEDHPGINDLLHLLIRHLDEGILLVTVAGHFHHGGGVGKHIGIIADRVYHLLQNAFLPFHRGEGKGCGSGKGGRQKHHRHSGDTLLQAVQ